MKQVAGARTESGMAPAVCTLVVVFMAHLIVLGRWLAGSLAGRTSRRRSKSYRPGVRVPSNFGLPAVRNRIPAPPSELLLALVRQSIKQANRMVPFACAPAPARSLIAKRRALAHDGPRMCAFPSTER